MERNFTNEFYKNNNDIQLKFYNSRERWIDLFTNVILLLVKCVDVSSLGTW